MSPASLIGALAAAALLAGSGAAFAETLPGANALAMGAGYTAMDAPLGSPTELRIDLTGRVAARCELVAPPAAMQQLRLDRAGESRAAFAIDCNTPFNLKVRSSRGGFANARPTPGVEALAPYQVSVAVNTDAGRQDLGWCDAAALKAEESGCAFAGAAGAQGWSSGDATAIDQTGELRLRWRGQDDETPLLGAYGDTITIELEVRS